MWRRRSAFAELNTEVLLISFEAPETARWYLEQADFQWPVLCDELRAAYRAYGIERTSLARAWLSPRTVRFYLWSALRGKRVRLPRADSLQLGGDVLVDAAGVIRFLHRSAEPADRPSVALMERVVASGRSSRRQDGGGDG